MEQSASLFREIKPGYTKVMELIKNLEKKYPKISEIEEELSRLYKKHNNEYKQEIEAQELEWEVEKRNNPWKGVYPYKFAEYRTPDGKYVPEEEVKKKGAQIWVFRESDWTIMESDQKQSATTKDPNHPNYRYYQPIHPITGKPCSMPSRGWKGTQYRDPQYPDRNSWDSLIVDHRIAYGENERKVPQQKRFLHEVENNVSKSVIVDYSDGEKETTALFGKKGVFLAPKHTNFVGRFIRQATDKDSIVIDIFGGSGSTGSAVIRCNRVDDGKRKFILMEANSYIDKTILPRIKKTIFSSEWNNGKPSIPDSGTSYLFKYNRIESYEDALNNLAFREDATRAQALAKNDVFRREYMLNYWLEFETKGSPSLLSVEQFTDPTAYKLKIKKPGSDEYVEKAVDLIETFNWLIGLHVDHIDAPRTFGSKFKREADPELPNDQTTRLILDGKLAEDANGKWWFRKVEGRICRTPGEKKNMDKVLIIWSKLTGNLEEDNLMLDEWFRKYRLSTQDTEFDVIYVNGSNNLPNLKRNDENWKVRLIEESFHQKMWDVEG